MNVQDKPSAARKSAGIIESGLVLRRLTADEKLDCCGSRTDNFPFIGTRAGLSEPCRSQ